MYITGVCVKSAIYNQCVTGPVDATIDAKKVTISSGRGMATGLCCGGNCGSTGGSGGGTTSDTGLGPGAIAGIT